MEFYLCIFLSELTKPSSDDVGTCNFLYFQVGVKGMAHSRYSKEQWAQAEHRYINGESLIDIGLSLKMTYGALQRRCTTKEWTAEKRKIGLLVQNIASQSEAQLRASLILQHEAKAHRISEKLISGVETVADTMDLRGPNAISSLNGLAQTLTTSVKVSRLSLGAVDPGTRVELSASIEHTHQHVVSVMESVRKLVDAKPGLVEELDLDAMQKLVEQDALPVAMPPSLPPSTS